MKNCSLTIYYTLKQRKQKSKPQHLFKKTQEREVEKRMMTTPNVKRMIKPIIIAMYIFRPFFS